MRSLHLLILYLVFFLSAFAQTDTLKVEPTMGHVVGEDFIPATLIEPAPPIAPDYTEHRWLFGIGAQNILDTYISPFEYKGVSHGTFHRSARPARWGRRRWQTIMQMCTNFSYDHSPTEDGKELYLQLTIGGGFVCNWKPSQRLRFFAGGLLEAGAGFTYNTRGSNNPAQGRFDIDLAATGGVEYNFTLFNSEMKARGQIDLPLMGAMFSPQYGQSYYEIFSLGHYNKNIRFISPFNAPSVRLLCTLDFPISRATISVGYHADIRQAHVNGLKRHAWSNQIVVGFVRHVKKIKHAKRKLE